MHLLSALTATASILAVVSASPTFKHRQFTNGTSGNVTHHTDGSHSSNGGGGGGGMGGSGGSGGNGGQAVVTSTGTVTNAYVNGGGALGASTATFGNAGQATGLAIVSNGNQGHSDSMSGSGTSGDSSGLNGVNGQGSMSSNTVIPVVIFAASSAQLSCPVATVTLNQLVTDSAQLITSASSTYYLTSTVFAIGATPTTSYYVQTSSEKCVLPYSELVKPTRHVTLTEYVGGKAVATNTVYVIESCSTQTVVETVSNKWNSRLTTVTRTLTDTITQSASPTGGLRTSTHTVTKTGTVTMTGPKYSNGTIPAATSTSVTHSGYTLLPSTSTSTNSSSPTLIPSGPGNMMNTTSPSTYQGSVTSSLCASFLGTVTVDFTQYVTSTTFISPNVNATSTLLHSTTYPLIVNLTAHAVSTSNQVSLSTSTEVISSTYVVAVPSTTTTLTTTTSVDTILSTVTVQPTTTDIVPSTITTELTLLTTTTAVYNSFTYIFLERDVSDKDDFDALVSEDAESVSAQCARIYGHPTTTITKQVSVIKTVMGNNRTVIEPVTSVVSVPSRTTEVVTTETAIIVQQNSSIVLTRTTLSVPSALTYVANTVTSVESDGTTTTAVETQTLDPITLYATTVVATQTNSIISTIVSSLARTQTVYVFR